MTRILNYALKLIILGYLALLFNGEFTRWSWAAFILPQLAIPLLIGYVLYIWLMMTLHNKAKYSPVQVFLSGSLVGLILEIFYSKSVFVNPILFGVNWISVIVQFFYWGMAATIPLYLYRNYAQKRNDRKFTALNIGLVLYLAIELVTGTILSYANPAQTQAVILIWIVTGTPLGILTFVNAIKHEDLI